MHASADNRDARDKLLGKSIIPHDTLFIASQTVDSFNSYAVVSLKMDKRSTVGVIPVLPGMSREDTLERVVKSAFDFADHDTGPLTVRFTVSPLLRCLNAIFERVADEYGIHDLVSWKVIESHNNEAHPALYSYLTGQ